MNTNIITFQADEQILIKTGGIDEYASDTVSYVEADFTLGQNWDSFDSVRAIWQSRYTVKQTVLNHEGKCIIPWEILSRRSEIQVNLVGSIVDGLVLTDRLTTFAIKALTVTQDVPVCSGETPISPSQFEEFVDIVKEDADRAEEGALASEAWAVGERNGTPVPDTDDTYENNSKYYAGLAEDWADKAEQGAESAGYMDMHINEDGHLIYTRTAAVDVDFWINHADGNLVIGAI